MHEKTREGIKQALKVVINAAMKKNAKELD